MAGGTVARAAAGDEPAGFAEAHRALLADRSIQFDLQAMEPPPTPGWLQWLIEALQAAGPVLRVLFWAVLAAIALAALYAIARRLWGVGWPWRRKRPEESTEEWRPDEAPARQLLSEADALAADGLYSQAAHLLLFRSIEDIEQRRPALVRPALTSRDIAHLPAIPPGPRQAFAAIAAAVERSLFGGRPLGSEDWQRCREAYRSFAFAKAWQQ